MNNTTNFHGNFIVVHKTGVLVTGPPGIGKSDLTLSLIHRGHQFICDDMVCVRKKESQLIGYAPKSAYPFIYIKALGLINLKKLYGQSAMTEQHTLDFVLQLTPPRNAFPPQTLKPTHTIIDILGIQTPKFILAASQHRPLPLLVEVLAKTFNSNDRIGYAEENNHHRQSIGTTCTSGHEAG